MCRFNIWRVLASQINSNEIVFLPYHEHKVSYVEFTFSQIICDIFMENIMQIFFFWYSHSNIY